MAIVAHEGLRLWLAGPTSSAARPTYDGRQPAPGGWNRLVIDVDDLDAAMDRMRESGVIVRNAPIAGPGERPGSHRGPLGQFDRAVLRRIGSILGGCFLRCAGLGGAAIRYLAADHGTSVVSITEIP
jgi:hypothetical protein